MKTFISLATILPLIAMAAPTPIKEGVVTVCKTIVRHPTQHDLTKATASADCIGSHGVLCYLKGKKREPTVCKKILNCRLWCLSLIRSQRRSIAVRVVGSAAIGRRPRRSDGTKEKLHVPKPTGQTRSKQRS